ncbi:hypothetical protein EV361DRAFT_25721 [Lentinula raphanica]|nr:hypothetical protein EV361DRAFT_25721 [Lentinula raphanica]
MFFCPRKRITSLVRRHHFSTSMAEWPYPIYSSERLHDRKSIFLAHASHLPNNTMLPLFLEVLTTSPKLKKATHCMYAYRTSEAEPEPSAANPNSKIVTGQHDGGENGSGNQLARLLDVTSCENTIVVVSRCMEVCSWEATDGGGLAMLPKKRWTKEDSASAETRLPKNPGRKGVKRESDLSRSDWLLLQCERYASNQCAPRMFFQDRPKLVFQTILSTHNQLL